ncbi:MAG: hypothetical protein K0Q50_1290 [Vampirovibrio sp.]|jgi:hypothetical protein|nr:hypothetical protein [Vampirovibrio sp.]
MSAFKHHRLLFTVTLVGILTVGPANIQPAMADTGWGSLLGPLIDNVIVPGIDKSIDNWQVKLDAKKAKRNRTQQSAGTADDIYGAGDVGTSTSEDIYGAGDTGAAPDSADNQAGASFDSSDVPPPVATP